MCYTIQFTIHVDYYGFWMRNLNSIVAEELPLFKKAVTR